MTYPQLYNLGLIRTDRGEFKDAGNQVYDVTNPRFLGGARGDGVTDDSAAIQNALDTVPSGSTVLCPAGLVYALETGLTIDRFLHFECYGTLLLNADNITGITLGGTAAVQHQRLFVQKIQGTAKTDGQTAVKMVEAQYNHVRVNIIRLCQYGFLFAEIPAGGGTSCPANQVFWTSIATTSRAVYFQQGARSGALGRSFMEGNYLFGTFISECDYGIYLDDDVDCGGIMFIGAIDNAAVGSSKDWYNAGHYGPRNLILSSFLRATGTDSQFGSRDMYIDPALGVFNDGAIYSGAALRSAGSVEAGYGTTAGVQLSETGAIEITSTAGGTPYVDFKDGTSDDYDARILKTAAHGFRLSTGGNGAAVVGFGISAVGDIEAKNAHETSVTQTDTSVQITLPLAQPDTGYLVVATPNWGTTCYQSARTNTTFDLSFGTAAPAGAKVMWLALRTF